MDRLLPPVLTLLGYKRTFASRSAMLRRVDERLLRPPSYGPPRWLRRDVAVTVTRHSGWPVYLLTPGRDEPVVRVVYTHGGAWVNEIHPLQWRFAAHIAAEVPAVVTVPIYPLAPVGTARAVVPAVADLVDPLVARYGADRTAMVGDSAGGQITLSAALLLCRRGLPPLRRTVLISPAVDLTLANPDIDAVEPRDPWLARPGTRAAIELWRNGMAVEDQLVSPLFADLAGLGPLTIFSGTRDITNPDTRRLVQKARDSGVTVDYHEERDVVHVHPLLPTPDGRRARRAVVGALARLG